jgi:hypothetical protein
VTRRRRWSSGRAKPFSGAQPRPEPPRRAASRGPGRTQAGERGGVGEELPAGESFRIEYVKDKPWGGYNWYEGGYRSLIQINTDLPFTIGEDLVGQYVARAGSGDEARWKAFLDLLIWPRPAGAL